METIVAVLVGVLMASSVYLMLSPNLVRFVLGLALISHAANLLIFAGGGMASSMAHSVVDGVVDAVRVESDAVAQALILTAIVISFSILTFALVLAFRVYQMLKTVDTDSMRVAEPEPGDRAWQGSGTVGRP